MFSLVTFLFLSSSFLFSGSQGDTCCAANPKNNYYLGDKQVNWPNAVLACQLVGMRLVSIQSQAKNEEISAFIRTSGVKNIGINNAIWISGNRRQDKVHWVWLTQEALVYTSWDLVFHEPNNATGDEECVSIISNNGTVTTWNDIACNRLFYPLCEKQICCSGCNCGCS
ncbi:C-type lectin lectoxin-Enh4-like isoform X1 [Diabrotica virgifera virgifera]|uniref:C-type lectin domain-containing protein n=1 Tax=Diabrotica virgifera virgifera TaxID=50390 RepID=A0ABM5JMK3_DIAVI|nr:C-type lectin lectoxin-Enh4-like isoform X1 [Diabrotica virgifera virgifera]